jgi:hypothetical protein
MNGGLSMRAVVAPRRQEWNYAIRSRNKITTKPSLNSSLSTKTRPPHPSHIPNPLEALRCRFQ